MSEFTIVADDAQARIFSRAGRSAALLEVEHVLPVYRNGSPDQFAEELARYIWSLASGDESGETAATVILGPQRFLSQLRSRLEGMDELPEVRYMPWDQDTSSVDEIANGLIGHGGLFPPRGVASPARANHGADTASKRSRLATPQCRL